MKLLEGDEGRTGTSCLSAAAAAACLAAVGPLQALLAPHSPGEAPGAQWVSSKRALPLRDHRLVPPALDGPLPAGDQLLAASACPRALPPPPSAPLEHCAEEASGF